MTFQERLLRRAERVQSHLAASIEPLGTLSFVQAMRHATEGGKGVRGFLVIETATLFDVPEHQSIRVAAAIEALHAYSLIHDDLPCMDDDDLRRGRPTVHVEWDEATAILAGDALQSLAFELLTRDAVHSDPAVRLALVSSLARAAGASGMVMGQALDILAETSPRQLTLEDITTLQAGKTGALITWSAEAGAMLGQADRAPLRRYATALGLAFQIADDILDVEGDSSKAGKRLQKDAAAGKATFVSHLGIEGARAKAAALVEEAQSALDLYGARAENLREAARFAIARDM